MHPQILTEEQHKLLPFISKFSRSYYLVGGTAIALQIGHRRSIDFDLFTAKKINKQLVSKTVAHFAPKDFSFIMKESDQVHYTIHGVKVTFFEFPFTIKASVSFDGVIRMPDLLTLSAMKAFAMGDRAKWKDYVDLFFLLKYHFTFEQIADKAEELFTAEFNSKLFRLQLSYFEGINYTEGVEYVIANPPSEDEIKSFLTEVATQPF